MRLAPLRRFAVRARDGRVHRRAQVAQLPRPRAGDRAAAREERDRVVVVVVAASVVAVSVVATAFGAANLESSLKVSKGQPSTHQTLISCYQVRITELQNSHRPQEWIASRCSSGLDP